MPSEPRKVTAAENSAIVYCINESSGHDHFSIQDSLYEDEWTLVSQPAEVLTIGFDYSTYTRASNNETSGTSGDSRLNRCNGTVNHSKNSSEGNLLFDFFFLNSL